MMTPHARPSGLAVLLEQVRVVGVSLRREAIVGLLVIAIVSVPVVVGIVTGGPVFDADGAFPTPLISFLIPFALWRGDQRFGPSFLWTLPVDRWRLAAAKVFGGWVWMMVALLVFTTWLLTLAVMGGAPLAGVLNRIPFVATTATYLLGSALVLGLRFPLRWLSAAAGAFLLLGFLSDIFTQPDDREWDYVPGARAWFSFAGRATGAWHTLPELAQWALGTVLMLAGGLAALSAALARHRELRRR